MTATPGEDAVSEQLDALLAAGQVPLSPESRTRIMAMVGLADENSHNPAPEQQTVSDEEHPVPAHHLAQLNIAKFRAPMDDPMLADFVAALDPINHLAEDAPGFVWRLTDEGSNDATSITFYDDPLLLVNMSVWVDVESLRNYVYRSAHTDLLRRRREWAITLDESHLVLWWVPVGHRPDLVEANDRLAKLRAEGPSEEAFTFAHVFPPPGNQPSGDDGPAGEVS
jgi:hypothetical protein